MSGCLVPPLHTKPLQHWVVAVHSVPNGLHIAVVVVVGVTAAVVVVVGVTAAVVVVVGVEKHVGGFGSRQSLVPPHPPQQAQGLAACRAAACAGVRQRVVGSLRLQVPGVLPWGTSQTLTVPGGQVIAIALVEGISAAKAVPAKSLSARRRLIEPSATARHIVEGSVGSFLAHPLPPSPKGGTLQHVSQ